MLPISLKNGSHYSIRKSPSFYINTPNAFDLGTFSPKRFSVYASVLYINKGFVIIEKNYYDDSK